jgi:hypothetical protein
VVAEYWCTVGVAAALLVLAVKAARSGREVVVGEVAELARRGPAVWVRLVGAHGRGGGCRARARRPPPPPARFGGRRVAAVECTAPGEGRAVSGHARLPAGSPYGAGAAMFVRRACGATATAAAVRSASGLALRLAQGAGHQGIGEWLLSPPGCPRGTAKRPLTSRRA